MRRRRSSSSAAAAAGAPQVSKSTVQTQTAKILHTKPVREASEGHLPERSRRQGGGHDPLRRRAIRDDPEVSGDRHGSVDPRWYGQLLHPGRAGARPGQPGHVLRRQCNHQRSVDRGHDTTTFLSALQANQQTIVEFQSTAPSKIVVSAGTLATAARQAIQSGDIAILGIRNSVAKAAVAVRRNSAGRAPGDSRSATTWPTWRCTESAGATSWSCQAYDPRDRYPRSHGPLAQSGSALPRHGRGQRFKSSTAHSIPAAPFRVGRPYRPVSPGMSILIEGR